MEYFTFFLMSLYMLLPAGLANMAPPFFKDLRFLDYQMDFGYRWKGKSLFGSHKTWRGVFFAAVTAIGITVIQKLLFLDYPFFKGFSIVDYSAHSAVLIGLLLGMGAMLGDVVESFLKRRVNIAPGKPWIPFDQVDYVIGSLLLLSIMVVPPWSAYVICIIAYPILHIITNHIGFYLGISKSKW